MISNEHYKSKKKEIFGEIAAKRTKIPLKIIISTKKYYSIPTIKSRITLLFLNFKKIS